MVKLLVPFDLLKRGMVLIRQSLVLSLEKLNQVLSVTLNALIWLRDVRLKQLLCILASLARFDCRLLNVGFLKSLLSLLNEYFESLQGVFTLIMQL